MIEGKSLISLGDLSRPATVLIEKISDAVGGYFKPYQVKRVAKAESEAEKIKAKSQIEISDLQRRAVNRFIAEESKKQENIETIAGKAIPLLNDSAKPQEMETDWITNFFDKCRIISDEEMQGLWSKVLAGEANSPGTFSKRTVNFLGSLDKKDAQLFTSLCGFAWNIGDIVPIIFDVEDQIYNSAGIYFNALNHLDNIGLLSFDNLSGFIRKGYVKQVQAFYYGKLFVLEFKEEKENNLKLGTILLSQTGQQLAKICGSKPVEGFTEYVTKRWKANGIKITSSFQNSEKTTEPGH